MTSKICKKCRLPSAGLEFHVHSHQQRYCSHEWIVKEQLDIEDKHQTTKEPKMPIKIELEDELNAQNLIWRMVNENQMFICTNNCLWIKVNNEDCSVQIADNNGRPYADYHHRWKDDTVINKILPKIKKIKF
jgi:hypothetical protein